MGLPRSFRKHGHVYKVLKFSARLSPGLVMGCLALAAFLFPSPARAAKFANQFVEFELPAQWQCNLEGAEWVCQSLNDQKKRDAIIILAAKLRGDQDSLDQYLAYLKKEKVYTTIQGKTIHSEPKYANNVTLNGQPWIDSLHLQSEIPGFYTRYLATVKSDIGVLVTYSINKDKWGQYQAELENLASTLKVFRKGGGLNAGAQGNLFALTAPNVADTTVFPGGTPEGGSDRVPTSSQKKDDGLPIEIILAVAIGVGFVIWKKKRDQQA